MIELLRPFPAGMCSTRSEDAMPSPHKITPCLWFDDQAEQAAEHYVGIFKDSRIVSISRYGEAGKEVHKKEPGTALTVAFELNGQPFTPAEPRASAAG
jgi:predicted 3-demethylubiquinone-9 3-methyltransferase (glyoxalase superfamily)